jgi:hypothetical protein
MTAMQVSNMPKSHPPPEAITAAADGLNSKHKLITASETTAMRFNTSIGPLYFRVASTYFPTTPAEKTPARVVANPIHPLCSSVMPKGCSIWSKKDATIHRLSFAKPLATLSVTNVMEHSKRLAAGSVSFSDGSRAAVIEGRSTGRLGMTNSTSNMMAKATIACTPKKRRKSDVS